MDPLAHLLWVLLLALDPTSHDVLVIIGLRVVADGVDKGLTNHAAAVEELALIPVGPRLSKVVHYLAVVPDEVVGDTLGEEGGVAED